MLDDKDIQKLVEAQKVAFKEEFATKKDVENLIDIVATKEEVNSLADRLDGRMDKLDGRMERIENVLKKIDDKLDEVVKLDKEVEYIKNTLHIPALESK